MAVLQYPVTVRMEGEREGEGKEKEGQKMDVQLHSMGTSTKALLLVQCNLHKMPCLQALLYAHAGFHLGG